MGEEIKNKSADSGKRLFQRITDKTWKKVLLWVFGILLTPYLWWLYLIVFVYWQTNKGRALKTATPDKTTSDSKVVVDDFITIQETKCTCKACKNVWFYGKEEVSHNQAVAKENTAAGIENCGAVMSNCGTTTMCCSGCAPAVLIPDKPIKALREGLDLDKCPKCGSRAVEKEIVTHKVKR